jgi:flavin reductase (DIM6/NTAB) family NADH-FMN oxidoreductase RutF
VDDFRAALSRFPSGITVVTSRGSAGELHGITVSAFCSVSLDPPLILVCIEKTTGSHEAIKETKIFAVNILAAGQDDLSERFSLPSSDKFNGVPLRTGSSGVFLLADALVVLECRLKNVYDGGDHSIFVGEVEEVEIRDGNPLVYFHGLYRDLLDG